jgi:hypothetical protein
MRCCRCGPCRSRLLPPHISGSWSPTSSAPTLPSLPFPAFHPTSVPPCLRRRPPPSQESGMVSMVDLAMQYGLGAELLATAVTRRAHWKCWSFRYRLRHVVAWGQWCPCCQYYSEHERVTVHLNVAPLHSCPVNNFDGIVRAAARPCLRISPTVPPTCSWAPAWRTSLPGVGSEYIPWQAGGVGSK